VERGNLHGNYAAKIFNIPQKPKYRPSFFIAM
jgi:hypothetical protein